MKINEEKIAIIGLGYVGLPVAVAFAKKFESCKGFDINLNRVQSLKEDIDWTGEITNDVLKSSTLSITSDLSDLKESTFYVVAVPTPIDQSKRPNLNPIISATKSVAQVLNKGDVVVYESTVYPGLTRDICLPILEKESGLKHIEDFSIGYSPERINPGDKVRTIENIIKIVSGDTPETLERISAAYSKIIKAGLFKAASIEAAEAAKIIENTQRDINIALMNEIAMIFDRLGLRTKDVLEAAGSKWNFLPFHPGLVGGHCIGVDPYYLTEKAEALGYHPQVILAGRRINDNMGAFIAQKVVKLLIQKNKRVKGARVGILGLTFKENVSDLRNSRVPDIIQELGEFGADLYIHDAYADKVEAQESYGVDLLELDEIRNLDVCILAVPHDDYMGLETGAYKEMMCDDAIFIDIKSVREPDDFEEPYHYWSL